MRGAGPVNAYEHNINLTMELQRIVNEQLRMEELPMMSPDAAPDFNITANDDIPMADFFGEGGAALDEAPIFGLDKNDLGLEGLQNLLGQKGRAAHKKQVYQIRDAMMKFDKKTQRAQVRNAQEENDEDIVKNMTNLILNKKEDKLTGRPPTFEKNFFMDQETASNTFNFGQPPRKG